MDRKQEAQKEATALIARLLSAEEQKQLAEMLELPVPSETRLNGQPRLGIFDKLVDQDYCDSQQPKRRPRHIKDDWRRQPRLTTGKWHALKPHVQAVYLSLIREYFQRVRKPCNAWSHRRLAKHSHPMVTATPSAIGCGSCIAPPVL